MANIETLISRYLDGELTPAEQAYVRRLLAESPDARAVLREMTEVSRAARRMPRMHAPQAPLEAMLFHRLQAEGFRAGPARPAVDAAPTSSSARVRGMVAAGLLLLLLAIGGGYWKFQTGSMAHAPVSAGYHGMVAGVVQPNAENLAAAYADHGAMVAIPSLQSSQSSLAGIHNRWHNAAANRPATHNAVADNAITNVNAPTVNTPALNTPSANVANATINTNQHTDSSLAAAADGVHAQTPDRPASITPSETPRAIVPVIPPTLAGLNDVHANHWIASFRGGMAQINDAAGTKVRELDMKVGMQMESGHKVSFIVGLAPAISETRRENTGVALSSPALSQIPSSDGMIRSSDQVVEYERTVRNEPWFGLGYNYSVSLIKDVSIDPGMKAGASASTWRIGAELPVSYRMSKSMSIECAVSLARILPRTANADDRALTDTPDHFIYEQSKALSSFTTYGVQLGIRLELPASK